MERIPDTTEAEKWIDADTFEWEGELYKVMPDGTIERVKAGKKL